MKAVFGRICVAIAVFGLASLRGTPAHGESESPWRQDTYSALRLIGGGNSAGTLRAGIQIRLAPAWHTYWRYPGDSGIPPRFSFSGSDNVASAKVLYPAPHAYRDDAGVILGYTNLITFPVRVVPRDKAKPVTLRLKAEYAVCEKLCVPVEAQAELTLSGAADASDAVLAAAEAQVPKPVDKAVAGLIARRVDNKASKPLVLVDLAAPAGQPVEVFVEGPTPEWALPIPKPAPGAPTGRQHFSFELDGLPPGVDPKKGPFELTFTIVRGGQAIEVKTHLD